MTSNDFLAQAVTHLPEELRNALLEGRNLPEHAEGTVLFADISGYTPLSKALSRAYGPRQGAEELIKSLNLIFEDLITEVSRYHGSVISFAGDAITCWFDDQVFDEANTPDGSQRAASCAFAMQSAMGKISQLAIPGEGSVGLGVKISMATGPVRRFLVGDAACQRILVLAGETLQRMEAGAQITKPGEVLADENSIRRLESKVVLASYRFTNIGEKFTIVAEICQDVDPNPWPDRSPQTLSEDQLRPWLLPQVFERLIRRAGRIPDRTTSSRSVIRGFYRHRFYQ